MASAAGGTGALIVVPDPVIDDSETKIADTEAGCTGVLIDVTDDRDKKKPDAEVYDENLVLPPLQLTVDFEASASSQENQVSDTKPEPKKEICTYDSLLTSDIKTLDEEEFDFDLALSPDASQDEDEEEEVFFGPVGFTETCVSAAVEISKSPEYRPLSPLNAKQVAELFKEANVVACRLSALSVSDKKKKPFPKVSLKDSIRRSVKKIITKPGNKNDLGLPRIKLDFTSPEVELDVKKISETLPVGKLPLSPQGVKCFRAEKSKDEKKNDRSSLPRAGSKLCPPNSRRSGIQKPKIGLGRAPSLRVPKRYSPLKRQRTNSLGSDIDTCSTASDVSDASSISIGLSSTNSTSKRHLPCPKFQPSRSLTKPGPSKPKTNTSAIQSTLAKSSLLKPSALPNKTSVPNRTSNNKTGPLKATASFKKQPLSSSKDIKALHGVTAPSGKENKPKAMKPPAEPAPRKKSGGSVSSVESATTPRRSVSTPHRSVPTPHRTEKHIQPKCLLPNSVSVTPVKAKSSSVSSDMSTPASSSRRRSFLPTPKMTPRSGSTGSISKRSPRAAFTPSKMGKTKGAPPIMKKPLVMNTPQAQQNAKKPSMWSPIARRKPSDGEEYITCTKRSSRT